MNKWIFLLLAIPFVFSQVAISDLAISDSNGSDCFIPMAQISLEGQINFSAFSSLKNARESNGYIYLKDENGQAESISIFSYGNTLQIEFNSDKIEDINSRLAYLNSLNLILVKDSQNMQARLRPIADGSCPPLRAGEDAALPSPAISTTPSRSPVASGKGADNFNIGTSAPETASKDSQISLDSQYSTQKGEIPSSLTLESMILPMVLGSISTLFLILAVIYFRGHFFKPVEYPAELTIGKTQLEILEEIRDSSKIPTDIALRIKKSKSTVIEHLDSLQSMGLVEKVSEPGRKFVYYRLSTSGRRFMLAKSNAA